jgi:hypothetical protein
MARGQPQTKPDELPWLPAYLRTYFAQLGHGLSPLPELDYVREEGENEKPDACVELHGGIRRCRIKTIRIVVEYEEEAPGALAPDSMFV